MRFLNLTLLGFTLAFFFSGCMTVSQLQSAKVLDEGKGEIGGGAGALYIIPWEYSIWARYGLGSNLDFGLKVHSFPGISGDLKYQITKDVPYFAGDIGVSYARVRYEIPHIITPGSTPGVLRTFALSPALIVGGENFYASIRTIIWSGRDRRDGNPEEKYQTAWPGISLGYTLGEKFRITPEVSIFYGKLWKGIERKYNLLVYPALGISVRP